MSEPTTEKRFSQLKRDVKEATNEAARAQGALDETVKQLKDEFGCSSLKSAKALLGTLKTKADDAGEAFETALNEYETKWHGDDESEE